MLTIRIAAAQSASVAGDIATNIETHCRFIDAAAHADVGLLVFPELSLSGYELAQLASCVLAPDDAVLAPIRQRAVQASMAVMVGASVAGVGGKPCIGAITFLPNGSYSIYRKQYLHPGEEVFAACGAEQTTCHSLGSLQYAVAICADTAHAQHAKRAAAAGASLYVAGVLVSEAGYVTDAGYLQSYAYQHGMGVLMANHGGPSGGYISAGKSAFWMPDGKLLVQAPCVGSYLVMASFDGFEWKGALREVGTSARA
jgi:predicted amidohydrolase